MKAHEQTVHDVRKTSLDLIDRPALSQCKHCWALCASRRSLTGLIYVYNWPKKWPYRVGGLQFEPYNPVLTAQECPVVGTETLWA